MKVTHGDIAGECARMASALHPFHALGEETGSDLLATTEYDELFLHVVRQLHTGGAIQDLPHRAVSALSCRLLIVARFEMMLQRSFPDFSLSVDDLGVFIALLVTDDWNEHATEYLLDILGYGPYVQR